MASFVIIKSNDKNYKLEYNRSSIVRMEENGFDVQKMNEKPLSTIVLLMRGAFYMHNPSLTDEEIDAICEQITNSEELVKQLVEMYMKALNSLVGDKKQEKNFKWEKN